VPLASFVRGNRNTSMNNDNDGTAGLVSDSIDSEQVVSNRPQNGEVVRVTNSP
jgi:hypothetical protein